jgi:DNA-binding LytR/AlgR family response regulator
MKTMRIQKNGTWSFMQHRFIKACNKAKELYQLKSAKTGTAPDYFFVNADYTLQKVIFNDIMWIEGLKDYIKIHLKSTSKPLVTRMSMKSMEELLPHAKFIRVHKSFIISLSYVTAVRKKSVFIGSTEITISDSYPDAIATIIGKAAQL